MERFICWAGMKRTLKSLWKMPRFVRERIFPMIACGIAAGLFGCGKQVPETKTATATPLSVGGGGATVTFSDFPVPSKPAVTKELVQRGKKIYEENCSACHGSDGNAQGKCSVFLIPRPRNFRQAHYRIRSTPSGHLPTDEDLFRIVSIGVNGTPMPPWRFHMSEEDRWAVVEYIKTFSPRFANSEEDRKSQVELGAPPPRNEQTIAEGKRVYENMGCANCHGERGEGDGPSSETLTDDSGLRIRARDFTKPSGFKAGYATKEIVRGFLTGFDGTPMPSFDGTMSREEAWKLAYYVETLVKTSTPPIARASQNTLSEVAPLGNPDVVVHLTERGWKYDPQEIRVKKGQIVEVIFEPTDNGLGAGHGFAVSSYDEVAFINGAMVGAPKKIKFRADRAGQFTFYCATQCSTEKLHPLMNGTFIVEDPSNPSASLR